MTDEYNAKCGCDVCEKGTGYHDCINEFRLGVNVRAIFLLN